MPKKPPRGTCDDVGENSKKRKLVQTKLDVHFSILSTPMNSNNSGRREERNKNSSKEDVQGGTFACAALKRATEDVPLVDLKEDDSSREPGPGGSQERATDSSTSRHFWEESEDDSNESPEQSNDSIEPHSSPEQSEAMAAPFLGPTIRSMRRCFQRLPKLTALDNHTILFDTSSLDNMEVVMPPRSYPRRYWDKWDGDHVRMPCSKENEYPVSETELTSRWTLIRKALTESWTTIDDLKRSILSYNGRYAEKWNFNGLKKYVENLEEEERDTLFSTTLPKMAELALNVDEIVTHPIPLLKRGMRHTVTMTQQQAACLLANAFFCTFPRRNQRARGSEYCNYPAINFQGIFRSGKVLQAKLDFIFHYFRRVTSQMPEGTLSFQRASLNSFPDWSSSSSPLTQLHVSRSGTIEDSGEGTLQVDFANKFLGGGVLRFGAVQEEIRFLICPEMIISMLLTEALADDECLIMTGCERFSSYTGYGRTLQWSGAFNDAAGRDEWGRRRVEVVAIDAIPFSRRNDQFQKALVDRELNKAYCAFSSRGTDAECLSPVATGNWGCGAFGGDKELKSLIQIMAAAESGRSVVYYTFDDARLMKEMHEIYQLLVKKRNEVGLVYQLLMQYCDYRDLSPKKPITIFEFIRQSCC